MGHGAWLVVLFFFVTLFIRPKIIKNPKSWWLGATFDLTILVYLIAPFGFSNLSGNVRYAIPLLLISVYLFGYLLSFYENKKQKILLLLFCLTWVIPTTKTSYNHLQNLKVTPENIYQPQSELKPIINAQKILQESDKPKNIAYSGFNWHFLFYGKDLKNRVRHININDCQNCNYFDFRDAKDSIRSNPNRISWKNNLKAFNADYLIIKDFPGINMYEKAWAKQENWEIIFEENDLKIYDLQNSER
jgi:hypothetical protein